jgi:NAD(P)-dependent dehydrogenase (short-subunit alcohol dehydrogenase family)
MPHTILVSEGDTPLGGRLVDLLLARGARVVTTVSSAAGSRQGPGGEHGPVSAGPDGRKLVVPWNRRSPMSARTLLLDATNAFDAIDEAIVLEPPCAVATALHEMPSTDIERAFDDAKGPVFLVREVLASFMKKGSGVLCMVSLGPASGPIENAVRECFRGVCSALFTAPGMRGIMVNGFQAGAVGVEDYAAFIDRTLEEKARKISGRWFTWPARGGLFQGARPAARKG